MTHAEEILYAVAAIVRNGKSEFSRKDVRDHLGLTADAWMSGYVAIFQAMRVDHPGGAPPIGRKYRGVFRLVQRGRYTLTEAGRSRVRALAPRVPAVTR